MLARRWLMALFVIQAGAASGSAATKVANQVASTSTKPCIIVGLDITFDGTTATNTPIEMQLSSPTAAGSGGSTFTPLLVSAESSATSSCTARVNDTTAGASPSLYAAYYVPPTSGFVYQFPLGREVDLLISDFLEWKVVTVSGSGTPNYRGQIWFVE